MKVALLGLAQSGRKTFFSLLTGREVPPGLKEGESLEGNAPIRDPRVDKLTAMYKPERTKYAENRIVLCPPIVAGRRDWLDSAKRCDLLCLLVRAFTDPTVYHQDGSVDAGRDRSALETELWAADLELVEKRLDRIAREKKAGQDARQILEERTLEKIKAHLESAMKISMPPGLEEHELETIRSLELLSCKPVLWVYNVDEDQLKESSADFKVSCRIEREIMDLDPAERAAYLQTLGISQSGLDRLNQAAYAALGLMSFYTVGEDEVRAWTIRVGTAAPAAGGKVHTDIERGFIRVEVMRYDDLIAAGGEEALHAQGKIHLKGRDYIIADGDICHFRFNV